MPERRLPVIAAGLVVALALPVFLIAGWPVRGWALGAVLWIGSQLLGLVFARAGIGDPNLRGSGARRLRDDGPRHRSSWSSR